MSETALHVEEQSDLTAQDQTISFGSFGLLPSQRLLLKDNEPVQLGGRALDILIALTRRAGEPVTNGDLVAGGRPQLFHSLVTRTSVSRLTRIRSSSGRTHNLPHGGA